MENYKQQIIDRGYKVVAETEDGISFVNEEAQFCAMLLFKYNSLSNLDKDHGHDLHETLKDKYPYANKATICVIVDYEGDAEKIQRNEYYFSKIFTNRINILPSKVNKGIRIIFEPMVNQCDLGSYTINPFENVDGFACANFYDFLSSVTKDCVVKYPRCLDIGYFRWVANKLFDIETVK